MKRLSFLAVGALLVGLVVVLGFAGKAKSNTFCPAWVDVETATECQVTSAHSPGAGPWAFGLTLHVTPTGHIDGSTTGITLNITGDLLVDNGGVIEADDDVVNTNASAADVTITATGKADLAAGSRISADNNLAGGTGGDVSVTVNGDMTLHGTPGSDICRNANGSPGQDSVYGTGTTPNVYLTPSLGARISAIGFGSSGNSFGGTVTLKDGFYGVPPTGAYVQERCALVDVSATSPAGAIAITSGKTFSNAGLILSESAETGVGANQPPGGGPITIKAGCQLTVTDTGMVSSKGRDPGADLVHLEGCDVLIQGIVQSTGQGHATPSNPPNHCNSPQYPYQHSLPGVSSFTACVEIWANNITIDASGTHNGNVNVDGITSDSGGPRAAWLDLFAAHNINILGDPVGSGVKWAVSASTNSTSNDYAGLIEIWARGGSITTTGQAVTQANATVGGSNGGKVDIQAGGASPNGDVNLDGSWIQAVGATSGTGPQGGEIDVRSYHGAIIGSSGGQLNAAGGPPLGVVNLTECGAVNQYLGTITPPPGNHAFNNCGGTLTLPANATTALANDAPIWDACTRAPSFSISGTKHRDTLAGAGLPGWTIRLYDMPANTLNPQSPATTDGSGNYVFTNLPAGQYKLCEVKQLGWTQTAPNPGTATCTAVDEAPNGIAVTIGPSSTGNDFANTQPPQCEKQPVQQVLDPSSGRFPGNKGIDKFVILSNGDSIQNAIDTVTDTNNDGYLLIQVLKDTTGKLGGSTNQRFTISQDYGLKTFGLIGCSNTLNNPTPNTPTEWIQSSAKSAGNIFVMDLHGSGSQVAGIQVDGSGREIRNAYADNNTGVGYLVTGSGNTLHNGEAVGNTGDGYYVTSSSNTITDANAYSNGGNGFDVVGNSNTLNNLDAGDKNKGNTLDGIHVVGNSNTISGGGAFANKGDGIDVAGDSNTFTNNESGDRSGKANTGDGYRVAGSSNYLNGNKASSNGANGFEVSGGGAGANRLKNDASNGGSSGSDQENGLAEFRFLGTVKNDGGGDKADSTAVPKTNSPVKCNTSFPAQNATATYGAAVVCE